MPNRRSGTATVVALVLALAALVAVASRGTPLWTLVRDGHADRVQILVGVALLSGLGMAAAGCAAVVLHRASVAGRPHAPALRATLLRTLPAASAAVAVSGLLLIARTDLGPGAETDGRTRSRPESSGRRGVPFGLSDWFDSPVRAGEGAEDAEGSGEGRGPDGRVPTLLLVLGAVAVAAAGAAAWRFGRTPASAAGSLDDDAADAGHMAIQGAVAGTIDAMLADPDPNTAIRGAYARLLEGLEACGTPRRDYEAPMEHLERVLAMRRVRPQPLRRLIELFEVARFSTQPLNAAHRDRALGALRDVAADLAGAFPVASRSAGSRPVGQG